jgi:menaquinone-dependent protoporphyrinogen oxidase
MRSRPEAHAVRRCFDQGMTRILVAYATKKGSTREVAAVVAETLAGHGLDVEVREAADTRGLDGFDGVVLGAALYTGRLHADARAFLRDHAGTLAALPFAIFGMGPRTLAGEEVTGSRKQLDAALAKVPEVRPLKVAIFGGVLDPAQHRFPFSRMAPSDARDWDAIEAWADQAAAALSAARPAPTAASATAAAASSR